MPKKKYTPLQEGQLALLAAAHLRKVQGRAVLRAQIEAQLNDALNDIELAESREANVAIAMGVTRTDVGRAMGTANWDSISKILARTAHDLTAADYDPRNDTYSFEGDQIRVTLTPAEITAAFANFADHAPHPEAPNSALFSYSENAGKWQFQGQSWLGKYEHPLSLWSAVEGNTAEIAEWAAEHALVTA